MKLYFIGGASGSGKTAVISPLQKILGHSVAVHDFDDIGVPKDTDKKWRQQSTERWLQRLLNDGQDACLLGQIVLGEILACPSSQHIDTVNFCLLDVDDFNRIQRLITRNTHGIDQNTLNWSSWLRMHTRDPRWAQHAIKENCWSDLDFNNWDKYKKWGEKINIFTLDTTHLTLNEVATNVAGKLHAAI